MDTTALDNLDRCIEVARRPRLARFAATPGRALYSVGMSQLCRRFGFVRHKSVRTFWGDSMEVVFPELLSRFIYRFGFFESDLSTLFARYLRPGMTVFDIGAHYGYVTLLCAHSVGPTGRVHSFEPTPSTFEVLSRNAGNKPNVVLNQAAVSNEPGELKLLDFGIQYAMWNSAAGGRLDEATVARVKPQEFVAKAVTIDGYVDATGAAPGLIKIDAEKAEHWILAGAERTLRERRPVVVMEVGDEPGTPPEQASIRNVRHLLERGYRIYEMEGRELVAKEPQEHYDAANLIFVPAEKGVSGALAQ